MIIRGCQTWDFSPDLDHPAMFRFPEGKESSAETRSTWGLTPCRQDGASPVLSCLSPRPPQRSLNMIIKYIAFSITSTAVLFVSSLLTFAP